MGKHTAATLIQSNYYRYPGETPTRLGINPEGVDENGNKIKKQVKTYRVIKKVKVLKSTADVFDDILSVPGESFHAEGGAIQLMTTDKSAFEEVTK